MADTNTATFDLDDLKASVGEIHSALSQGGNERELLQHALQVLDKCAVAMDLLQQAQQGVAKGQRAIRRSQDWTEAQLLTLGEQQEATLEGLKALLTVQMRQLDQSPGRAGAVGKSRLVAIAGKDRTAPPAVPDDPAAMVKQGVLKGTLAKIFGAGAQQVTYDGELASRLLMKAQITRTQHALWKKRASCPRTWTRRRFKSRGMSWRAWVAPKATSSA